MKSIIEEIYYGNVSEADKSYKNLKNTKEFINMNNNYNKLVDMLNSDQQDVFDKFCEYDAIFYDLINVRTYKNGVKLGMCLMLELLNYKV